MNDTSISSGALARLADEWNALTPEARKACRYVLENPHDVEVSTVREIARAANVKPNTLVRMARQVGFSGYEDFRAPFRETLRHGAVSFPDRAQWLQSASKSGHLGALYAKLADAAIRNIGESFASTDPKALESAAHDIRRCRSILVLGVGVHNAAARLFSYLASTEMRGFRAIPSPGLTPIDDLTWTTNADLLIAMTCRPYRTEVVDAVRIAREQGLKVIALTSPASLIALAANHVFVVSSETPQFFLSSLGTVALLETLLSFVIAVADRKIVERVERFRQCRQELGVYVPQPS